MNDIHDFNRAIITEFHANKGVLGGVFEGKPVLLLHHTGARTGQERINPVMYQQVGDGFAIFASAAGAPEDPQWFRNLLAHPEATVEIGEDEIGVTARVAEGPERDEIWEKQKADYHQFAEYEAKTTRTIPVVILTPR